MAQSESEPIYSMLSPWSAQTCTGQSSASLVTAKLTKSGVDQNRGRLALAYYGSPNGTARQRCTLFGNAT